MNALTTTTKLELDGAASWPVVKYWADLAAKFQHASVAAQVMAGFALCELRKTSNKKPGNPNFGKTSSQLPHDVVIAHDGKSWADMVQDYAGISDETARRWMLMAEGIKARWKKLAPQARLKQLMAVSPSDWNEKDTKLVCDSLHKVADGSTQLEFMRELGLAKAKPGNANPTSGPHKKLTTEQEQARAIELALEDSGMMGRWVSAANKSFMLTARDNDVEISAQISVLEFALKLRHKYLNTPRAKRGDALVKEIENLIAKDSPLKA